MSSSSPPPEKKFKDLATISMVVEKWDKCQLEQLSPVVRINDYNWRLRLYKFDSKLRYLSLICDKSKEAALWECTASVKSASSTQVRDFTFASWIQESIPRYINLDEFAEGTTLDFEILGVQGEIPRLRPNLGLFCERDATIWIGQQKIHVNKESLCSQSSFFTEFFAKVHKKNKPNEFVLPNVNYEEFTKVLQIYYEYDGVMLTDENIHSTLMLASRFDLQIVEDQVITYLLSSATSFSIHQRLLIADRCSLPFLKGKLIRQYYAAQLKELCTAPEWEMLSPETTRALMMRRCEM